MWRNMLKVAAATAAFGVVHSLLASRAAKRAVQETFGERNRNGLYRVIFIGQSFATLAILAAYIRRHPSRELYRVEGPLAWLMHAVHGGALVYATAAAAQVGIRRITGIESLAAWSGDGVVPKEPEAQGPALDEEGSRHPAGPFRFSRHPLNLAPIPLLWLWPRMTTSLLAFNVVATAYLVAGSLHEEQRLRAEYGRRYDEYRESGVPYFMPGFPATALRAPHSIKE
ncbi:MAG: hypothetical protein IT428_21560 [Planctomycetaceae bacterium]|nr:hypothetical protein [Planctomycetaceae bacterium]